MKRLRLTTRSVYIRGTRSSTQAVRCLLVRDCLLVLLLDNSKRPFQKRGLHVIHYRRLAQRALVAVWAVGTVYLKIEEHAAIYRN